MEQNLSLEANEFRKIVDEMYELYRKKNANYGNSFGDTWKDFGIISGCTRLADKMNRLKSLVKGSENNFESIEDTFIDMANYAIMCVIELRKENK